MAKRKTGWTEEKIARYYKEGRGSGEFSTYKPWLTVQDVPSKGRTHRLKGWKTSRIHHLLSDLERNFLYLMEWAEEVLDIREQFPIARERTLKIAEQLNINHPEDQDTKTPIVARRIFLLFKVEDGSILSGWSAISHTKGWYDGALADSRLESWPSSKCSGCL